MMIYCDMDGVLVNFHKECSSRVGYDIDGKEFQSFGQGKRNMMYSEVCDTVDFWVGLEAMPDYDTLWGYIRYWSPSILTAYPRWGKNAIDPCMKGKLIWNKKHMMVTEDRMIIVARNEKQKYALNSQGLANLLIDDKKENIDEWHAAGGVGILHTSAAQTVKELKELGFRK